jgi:HPt (histidine-containing phosphotransfer) domain-containing protein
MHEEAIDLAALRRLLDVIGGDPDDFAELVDDYVAGAPDLTAEIRSAASSTDWATVCRAAHTLKSNARDFGAMRLATLCASLETASRQGRLESPESVISEIEIEEAAARQALRKISVDDVLG